MTDFSHTGVTYHALHRNHSLLLLNEIFPYYHLNDSKSEYVRWPPEISANRRQHLPVGIFICQRSHVQEQNGLSIASIAKRH